MNALGPLDLLQIAASGLKPGQPYRLWLVASRSAPFGQKQSLATFKANLAGALVGQAIGSFRQILSSNTESGAEPLQQRFLMLTAMGNEAPELIQNAP